MTSNDILRRLRYVFDFSDVEMIALFEKTGQQVAKEQLRAWLKKEDDPAFQACSDSLLAAFLNGLIIDQRGPREGVQAEPEKTLTNNLVFNKLKIALNLKADDVLKILRPTGLLLSPHELSAFFRKPGHKHYRECKDQVLRNFLKGLQLRYRDQAASEPQDPAADHP